MEFRIREAREKAGYSQKELAQIIGVAQNTFHGYESGKHDPKSDFLIKIAQACDVTVDFLLGCNITDDTKNSPSTAEAAPGEALHSVDDWKRAIDKMTKKQCRDAIILLLDKFMEGEE